MAEGARLESVYTGNRIVGSNPTPSARTLFARIRPCSKRSDSGNCLKEGLDAIKAGNPEHDHANTDRARCPRRNVINEYFSGQRLPKEELLPIATVTKTSVARWEAPCTY